MKKNKKDQAKLLKSEKKRLKGTLKKLTKALSLKTLTPERSYGPVGDGESVNRAVLQIELLRASTKRGSHILECTLGRFLGDTQYLWVYLDDEDPLRKVQEFVNRSDENAIIAVI